MRSGFSIVKNGESLGYPYLESLRSLAPIVDEIVVAHGDSRDGTAAALRALAPQLPCPLVIVDSPWDAQNTRGGQELARQTNIALKSCRGELCFYLQSDELLHEKDYPRLNADLDRLAKDPDVDALALAWLHFYGNFDTVVESRLWYRREVRAFKKAAGLQSYGDAQGFRIPQSGGRWRKPRAALSGAGVYHYGWVRPPQVMAQKSEALDRLWHGHARDGQHRAENVYPPHYGMKRYTGTHPVVMRERVKELAGFDPFQGKRFPWGAKYLRLSSAAWIESLTGWRPGEFKNYELVKTYP